MIYRSGLQDEKTKKVIEEIKHLEYQLQADIKKVFFSFL